MGPLSFVRDRKQVKADRATAQGVAGHQAAMAALQNASLATKANLLGPEPHPDLKAEGYERESMPSAKLHVLGQSKPEIVGSSDQKVSKQRRQGLITDLEAIKDTVNPIIGERMLDRLKENNNGRK